MSQLAQWIERAIKQWNASANQEAFEHGYWALAYKINGTRRRLPIQPLQNAIAAEANNSPFDSTSPQIVDQFVQQRSSSGFNYQWWCASCDGEVFYVQRFDSDRRGKSNRVDALVFAKECAHTLKHARLLAARIGDTLDASIDFCIIASGLDGRALCGPSGDQLGTTGYGEPEIEPVEFSPQEDKSDPQKLQNLLAPLFYVFKEEANAGAIQQWIATR